MGPISVDTGHPMVGGRFRVQVETDDHSIMFTEHYELDGIGFRNSCGHVCLTYSICCCMGGKACGICRDTG